MTDPQRAEIRRIVEEVLDERERADPTLGVTRVPQPRENEPGHGLGGEKPGHGHDGESPDDVRAREEQQEREGHEHMHHFPLFVRDEKGEVVELDPSEVPRFQCDEPGCDDPTHQHGSHDHPHHHHDHEHREGEGAERKPRRRRSSR